MTQAFDRVVVINRIALPAKAPDRVLVVPWGNVESTTGDFIVDAECAAAAIDAFKAHGVDLPIDTEHHTMGGEFSSPTGEAPAVGWIKSLSAVEGEGIFAEVEWTEHGAELVETKAYRYLSPVTLLWKKDKRLAALHSVALTNKPAITGMHPIVNKDKVAHMDAKFDKAKWFLNLEELATEQEILMKLEEFLTQLRELAGAAENADQAAVLSALKEKAGAAKAGGELRATVCKAAGVDEKAKDDEIVSAINSFKTTSAKSTQPDPAKYVPVDEHKKTLERLNKVETEMLSINAEAFIGRGIEGGRICEANKAAWKERFKADPDDAKKALELVPEATWPKTGQIVSNSGRAPGLAAGDRIVANADKFDPDGLGDYERIAKHAKDNKCTFQVAMEACGAL